MNTDKFNPEMLLLARDLRGMTQKDLANAAKLSQALVSQIEAHAREATEEVQNRFAEATSLPVEFFHQQENYSGFGISMVYYRKKSSALIKHLKRLQAEVNIRRIHLNRLIRGIDLKTPRHFEFMDIGEHGSPEDVAIRLRASWMLPLGPIQSLVSLIESAGGLVFRFPFGTSDIDAMSQWPPDFPPMFFINSQAPADRTRFTLAHELGHVVMHEMASADIENEANRFASEFLMPKSEIASQLMEIDLKRAAALKPYWRVSMAAIIRRAKDLKKITEQRYRELFVELGVLGYRSGEPYPLPAEEPALVPSILQSYFSDIGYSIEEMGTLLKWPSNEIQSRYFRATEMRLAQ